MGYNLAKRFSRQPESFGKGRIEGVFAPETAAHASGTAALLPMLALGIPGSGTAAILLGGLMVWGLNPGPLLFVEHKDFVWGLIASMYLGNIVGLVLVLTTVPIFASILRVPFAAVAPMIVVSCAIGAYAIQNAMFDIWLMLWLRRCRLCLQKDRHSAGAIYAGTGAGQLWPRTPSGCSMIGAGGNRGGVLVERPGQASIHPTLAIVLLFWPELLDGLLRRVWRLWRPARCRAGVPPCCAIPASPTWLLYDSAVRRSYSDLIAAQTHRRERAVSRAPDCEGHVGLRNEESALSIDCDTTCIADLSRPDGKHLPNVTRFWLKRCPATYRDWEIQRGLVAWAIFAQRAPPSCSGSRGAHRAALGCLLRSMAVDQLLIPCYARTHGIFSGIWHPIAEVHEPCINAVVETTGWQLK